MAYRFDSGLGHQRFPLSFSRTPSIAGRAACAVNAHAGTAGGCLFPLSVRVAVPYPLALRWLYPQRAA